MYAISSSPNLNSAAVTAWQRLPGCCSSPAASLAFFIFPWGLSESLWLSKHNHTWSLQQICFSFMWRLTYQTNMPEINFGLIESLISMADGIWQAYLLLNDYFLSFPRLLFPAAASVPVLPGLCDPPGPVGGLLLLPPRSLLPLLPRLRLVLLSRAGGARGRARLPRSLPKGAVWLVLRAHRVPGVLSGVLRDLPSQLEKTEI